MKWTEDEKQKLKDLLNNGFSYKEIGEKLNRTPKSIKVKTYDLGFKYKNFKIIKTKKCLECGETIEYSVRNKQERKRKFCNKSCAAKHNNRKRDNKIYNKISNTLKKNNNKEKNNKEKNNKEKKKCLYCDKEIENKKNIYCSNVCHTKHKQKLYIERWKNGEEHGKKGDYGLSNTIRTYLFKKYDNKCTRCGWSEKNEFTGKYPLDVDHIDGNATNNKEDNLRLLCPNCHSLTKTYKGANKGNGRHKRMERYYENKSY